MIHMTDAEVGTVYECGKLGMEMKDMALVLGVKLSEVLADFEAKGEVWQEYMRGHVETKMALRRKVLERAKEGEADATEEMNRYMRIIETEYGTEDTEDTEEETGYEDAG